MVGASRRSSTVQRPALSLEWLEDRLTPATQAFFDTGVLTVLGDAANNNILVAADTSGNLVVTDNGTPVAIQVTGNVSPVLAQTSQIVIDGKEGDDVITTDRSLNLRDANGKLVAAPEAVLLGGDGNDTITQGYGGFQGGVIGNPVLGNAYIDGGAGNDFINSGFGNDTIFGGPGNDTYNWLPGTLTDSWDGGGGFDTAVIFGNANAGDVFQLKAGSNGHAQFNRLNLVPFSVDISRTEVISLQPGTGDDTVNILDLTGVNDLRTVVVDGSDGNDTIDASAQLNPAIHLVAQGGTGNDIIKGGAGDDVLRGGDGDDQLYGNGGYDLLIGGAGNDRLDGGNDGRVDILIGGSGADTFVRYATEFDLFADFRAAQGDVFQDIP
ncbi:MAG TPA: calcium-binding protein [Candidatus Polarisedimenticolia bacterium]|nr:calcium-binding protein [Candidatus Polarisedimenticolia bacterium]